MIGKTYFTSEKEYTEWRANSLVKQVINKSVNSDGLIAVTYYYWVP